VQERQLNWVVPFDKSS
jgi:hypothetical protein